MKVLSPFIVHAINFNFENEGAETTRDVFLLYFQIREICVKAANYCYSLKVWQSIYLSKIIYVWSTSEKLANRIKDCISGKPSLVETVCARTSY